jgi:hypothetical protein
MVSHPNDVVALIESAVAAVDDDREARASVATTR